MKWLFFFLLCYCNLQAGIVFAESEIKNSQLFTTPKLTDRIVFSTREGDLVFVLYGNFAPVTVSHFKRLVELRLYEKVYVARVIKDFVFQFSEIIKSEEQLSDSEKKALLPVKSEFSTKIRHLRGVLSMAHRNGEPDSAVSSFSVILGNATHLDGKYTIFGELESGWNVINKVMVSSINGVAPATRLIVDRAYVVTDVEEYYKNHPRDTDTYLPPKIKAVRPKSSVRQQQIIRENSNLLMAITALTVMIVLLGIVALIFHTKLSKAHLRSLIILMLLVAGFSLLVQLFSMKQDFEWFA
ncbi:MAG: peptidylprolyl isomerase, partial [Thiohalomonadales bacterium]